MHIQHCESARFESTVRDGASGSIRAVIDAEVVRHVARLARLGLSDFEAEKMREELSLILDHVDQIQELDLTDVPPTTHVVRLVNVLREDVPVPSLDRALALREAPRVVDNAFSVPKI